MAMTLDLHILEGDAPAVAQLGPPARALGGLRKVGVQWLVAFLTELGSVPTDLDYGSSFMTDVRAGIGRGAETVPAIFERAAETVLRYQARHRDRDTPDEEILTGATLLDHQFAGGRLSLRIQLTSAAGDQRILTPPVIPLTDNP